MRREWWSRGSQARVKGWDGENGLAQEGRRREGRSVYPREVSNYTEGGNHVACSTKASRLQRRKDWKLIRTIREILKQNGRIKENKSRTEGHREMRKTQMEEREIQKIEMNCGKYRGKLKVENERKKTRR